MSNDLGAITRWVEYLLNMHGKLPWWVDRLDLVAMESEAKNWAGRERARLERVSRANRASDHQVDMDRYRAEVELGGGRFDPREEM